MNTIFKDIILIICDFLDDNSKLSFLSIRTQNHLLKNQIKFNGPLAVDSDIWYFNSFYHFISRKKPLSGLISKLSNCTHLTLVEEDNYSSNNDLLDIFANMNIVLLKLLTIKTITIKFILSIHEKITSHGINLFLNEKIILDSLDNNVNIIFEFVFESNSKIILMRCGFFNIRVLRAVTNQNNLSDNENTIIDNFIAGLNQINIPKDTLELGKKYVIQQKID